MLTSVVKSTGKIGKGMGRNGKGMGRNDPFTDTSESCLK